MLDNVFGEPELRLKGFAGRVVQIGVENPKSPSPGSRPPFTHRCQLCPSPLCFHTCAITDPAPGHQEHMHPLCAVSVLYLDRKGGFCGILTPPLDWELRKVTSSSPCAVTDPSISPAGAHGTTVHGRSHKCISESLIPNCQSLFQQPANTLPLVPFLHFSFLALTLLSLLLFLLCLQTTKQVKGR